MMHHESKMITFMCGENVCGPLMLACMSECSDTPLACIMMDMGTNSSCMEFSVVCDPSMGMMMVMPMSMPGCAMPMGMGPMSGSNAMMGSCMSPMAMGARGNGNGHCMGMGGNSMGMGMGGNSMGMGMGGNSMDMGCNSMGMGGNSMGMHMMSPMMRMICPMMMGSGRNMMHEGMGSNMCMMMGQQDMMNMSKLVLLKLDPMFACMDTCNMDVLRNAMKSACPIWQRRLQHVRGCAMVMISRNPMTHEICAVEHDSGRGMMMGGGEQRMCGMLTMMMPMRSKL